MKTRILSLIVAITAAVMPAGAYDFMKNGLCYDINSDGTSVTVTYQNGSEPRYTDLSGAITIPSSVTNGGSTYTVTAIGSAAFAGCTALTSVTMPNTVTTIGGYAFASCSGLSGLLTIPNKVTSIGENCFIDCSGLTQVTIPSSLKYIGHYAFNFCSNLKRVNITDIAAWCDIDFEDTASNPLSQDLYLNGTKVTNLVIPSSVTKIKRLAFESFRSLQQVTIPSSVAEIGFQAFYNCVGLTSASFPNTASIFIGDEAFYLCSSLTTLNVPSSICYIGINVFYGTPWYSNQPDGLVYAGNVAYKYKGTMPQGTSITLKNGCTGIGGQAFGGCEGLTSITIPNTVKIIAFRAFERCSGLTSITIPNSVTTVDDGAFYFCTNLSSVTIPKSVKEIGSSAFYGCDNLTRVNITDLNAWCDIDFRENVWSNPLYYAKNLYLNGTRITNLTIPSSISVIKNFVFNGCNINSVTIPNTISSIGDGAFCNCSELPSIIIPNSVTSIGKYAFRDCSKLTSVLIPNSVTSIGTSAFERCSSLASVTIPNSVTHLMKKAFLDCSSLSSVVTKIELPANVNYENYNFSTHFRGIPEESTLFVPVGTIEKYQVDKINGLDNPWLAFGNIQELVDGDVNLDGVVTSADVTMIYNHLLGGTPEHIATCDVNGDGNITAADVTEIYNMILN